MPGRYYDEWRIGDRLEHQPHRTVTETDNLLISTLTHNAQPLHLHAEYAAAAAMKLRSLLFVPGDRPDRMEKALGSGADALILDLEDAVAPAAKPDARRAVAAFLHANATAPLWVRINPLDGGEAERDLAA